MTILITALYAEGRTDERFLPVVLQRTLVHLLGQYSNRVVDVWQPMVVKPDQKSSRVEDILAVARKATGAHLMFIHSDADHPTRTRALSERVLPGISLVQERLIAGEAVCRDLIPVIPVQKVEAWMLADPDALRATIGTILSPGELGIPIRAHEIEGEAQPKERLTAIMRTAYAQRTQRRRSVDIGDLYQPLADQIRLEKLSQLPAYRQLISDITTALTSLGFISS